SLGFLRRTQRTESFWERRTALACLWLDWASSMRSDTVCPTPPASKRLEVRASTWILFFAIVGAALGTAAAAVVRLPRNGAVRGLRPTTRPHLIPTRPGTGDAV